MGEPLKNFNFHELAFDLWQDTKINSGYSMYL